MPGVKLPPISNTLMVNLPPLSATPVANNGSNIRCTNKIIITFLIEDFFHLPLVSMTPVVHMEMQKYFHECF